jgi:hypothetical protein
MRGGSPYILLKSASIAAGGLILSVPAARNAKLPHEQTKYRDSPKNN